MARKWTLEQSDNACRIEVKAQLEAEYRNYVLRGGSDAIPENIYNPDLDKPEPSILREQFQGKINDALVVHAKSTR